MIYTRGFGGDLGVQSDQGANEDRLGQNLFVLAVKDGVVSDDIDACRSKASIRRRIATRVAPAEIGLGKALDEYVLQRPLVHSAGAH